MGSPLRTYAIDLQKKAPCRHLHLKWLLSKQRSRPLWRSELLTPSLSLGPANLQRTFTCNLTHSVTTQGFQAEVRVGTQNVWYIESFGFQLSSLLTTKRWYNVHITSKLPVRFSLQFPVIHKQNLKTLKLIHLSNSPLISEESIQAENVIMWLNTGRILIFLVYETDFSSINSVCFFAFFEWWFEEQQQYNPLFVT